MIHEVDEALRTLFRVEALGSSQIAVVFDAPTRDWAATVNAPTVNLYLYDIREDMRRRERGLHNEYDEHGTVIARRRPPRYFKLSYLITAWTKRPEDEHRLLSSLLSCLLRYEALPPERLTGTLAEIGVAVPLTVALPPPEDRSFADVWSALGGELKPSLDLVVSVPVTDSPSFPAGPPVGEEGLRLDVNGMPAEPPGQDGRRFQTVPDGRRVPVYGSRPGAPADAAAARADRPPRRAGIASRIAEEPADGPGTPAGDPREGNG
ncbi:DUF4255 domain-containing protein [Streptomyces sp. NPDC018031]|uniref:DUF4255 domain-containing protein n=1 Tax=Streptomyces sp. NPDC018031 TaxID=3365033 RepID=UPI0037ADCF3E